MIEKLILRQDKHVLTELTPLSDKAKEVLHFYQDTIRAPQIIDIGPVTHLSPRYVGDEPPSALREYKIVLPKSLNEAYALLCEEHDQAMMQIVEGHKEWETDYQFAPKSLAFQVDGLAYPPQFLQYASGIEPEVLADFLKARVYEIHNNISWYDLNGRLWPDGTTNATWHQTLDELRQRVGKKVALLATTEAKLKKLFFQELGGVRKNYFPSDEEIRSITGFDAFMGPVELFEHFKKYSGNDSDYVFYGRCSRPTYWLEDPTISIDEPFLSDPQLRRYVRKYAITHNFDNPNHTLFDPRVITDTKAALCLIGSGYVATKPDDIYSQEFLKFLEEKKIIPEKTICNDDQLSEEKRKKLGKYLEKFLFDYPRVSIFSPKFVMYLDSVGVDPNSVANGVQRVRAKPLRRHYGAWGHTRSTITGANFVSRLMDEEQIRGPFLLQPEFKNFEVIDKNTGIHYLVIDRIFFVRGNEGRLKRMEGIRAFMPKDSPPGQRNNVHDSRYTLDARILEEDYISIS